MDIVVLTELLHDKGWQSSARDNKHYLLKAIDKPRSASFIVPACASELIPPGTLNAILQLAYARKETHTWASFVKNTKNIAVILEKQSDRLWGRIELPGLLLVTQGCTEDCISNVLRSLLIDFLIDEAFPYSAEVSSLPFLPLYDTTAVWNLIKQLKAAHIAEEIGVDMELVGQFMTGTTYPCPEVASRLEKSIQDLGRQLMEISIR
ncbi:hypothetical protein [Spirosoma utsteinense]|uniref:RNA binding protein YcfA (HicA-like mRNA interferase family) n=1 Tax=Spirosoma utsteinense TaxID=2585773 RepID=A0ABR6W935_9BACT|nr:hypothetical protein [Spirosoma utsteinense]MBC3787422.1 putative RNA binding protein YcfA (HicA-like mRNA interferase family) [Spirosoma utsteinense]MBC3793022.1 putative RNA binding protein YcfA (HicA-like mRNA interferase family) [Spirosoma utsteinense]